jgi:hypothetical protein
MDIFKKIYHILNTKEKELLSVNNVKKIYNAWKKWRASYMQQEAMEGAPRAVARAPKTSDEAIRAVTRAPVSDQVLTRPVARAPTRVEVMPSEVPSTQNSPPVNVIDVQPEKQVTITKESADQGKDFF